MIDGNYDKLLKNLSIIINANNLIYDIIQLFPKSDYIHIIL